MKVLMISTDRLVFSAGSEVRRRMLDYGELFEELHVVVFTTRKAGYQKEQLTDNLFIYPTNSKHRLGYLIDATRLGQQILRGEGWIISSQDPFETGLIAWWLKKKFNLSWQAQIHTDFLSPYFVQGSLLNRWRVRLAKWLLPQADLIRVVSERVKNSLVSWSLKTDPIVLPIFVPRPLGGECDETLDLRKKYNQFSFIILMAARLTTEKNFSLALEAFAGATLDRPNVGLVIVGDGPERERLQRLAKTFCAGNQIIFEDWQCRLHCYYQTADLFLLTSNYEGYGRTLIEAGLVGCPILTTDVGLVGELLTENNSLICPVGDSDCLTEKISWAVSNHNQLITLGQKIKVDLEKKVTMDKEVYLQAYRRALEG